ncbi:BON domain-containing protein [Acanthopleuribacter pedis]|uniref:BON domain-containing protein n=1 Tax=Acanthopleuribacter pedis TaxID=442870 RepID=A0A8J7QMV5_9BACT|nr:BON domain-containing protein [Acanthopleuribacter pedis]MBO1320920.1 BON domain-containing protein [Acanthopleuribacter pedis]
MKFRLFMVLMALGLVATTPAEAESDNTTLEDTLIASKLWAGYALSESLNPLTIDIDVSDGTVSLHGEVDNRAEKNLAGSIAEGTEGVRDVENYLTITNKPDTGRSKQKDTTMVAEAVEFVNDTAIGVAVSSRLIANKHVSGFKIDVEVEDGHVSLAGKVSDKQELKIAKSIARNTKGVQTVTSHLNINEADREEKDRRIEQMMNKLDDAWIGTKINSQYAFTRGVDATDIDIEVDKGIVTLKGEVATMGEKELAHQIATDTIGVRKVHTDALEIK